MNRTQILNKLISSFNYSKYLEIGVERPNQNFNLIDAKYKIGVDPNPEATPTFLGTSDDFFHQNKENFDLIFIDGLHHQDQVMKDFENAFKILSPEGTIVIHDCNPASEQIQNIPQEILFWTGDVWKAWVKLRSRLVGVDSFVINTDWGCGVIKRNPEKTRPVGSIIHDKDLTYSNLDKNRKLWLNLYSIYEFKAWLFVNTHKDID